MNISYDRYIRTTDDYHIEAVQKIFKALYDKGYIYKGKYTGKYCTPCESFWTDSQLIDGKCPDCGRDVVEASEEAYFFKLNSFNVIIICCSDVSVVADIHIAPEIFEGFNNFINICLRSDSFFSCYFFKMAPFAEKIEKLLTETDYLQPKSRATELVNNFITISLKMWYLIASQP